ncbi:hypothetical protein [Microbacterium foliorum]|uniref:hypothetical protein n=1 Tax=Microbacterium foliorum TaxID=104336 RepID=UPI0012946E7F|nr:hypothetical protein [Microbacterium foliorum]
MDARKPAPPDRSRMKARPSEDVIQALADAITRLNGDGDFIARALTESLLSERPIEGEEAMSPQEINFLIRSETFTAEEFEELSLRVARGDLPARATSTLLASLNQSMSADDAAAFLDLTPTELRDFVSEGRLYAVNLEGHQRFPSWQFSLSSPGKVLPHLKEIIALLKGKDWISVSGLMSTPQSTMVAHGKQTPVEWFRSGGDLDALEQTLQAQKWR